MPTRQPKPSAAKAAAPTRAATSGTVTKPDAKVDVVPAANAAKKAAPATRRPPATRRAAQAAKTAKPSKSAKVDKPAKVRRKPVRDSFTMPEADFALIATLKARALSAQREVKKSELLRAGLHALAALATPALVAAIDQLEPVKIGRPRKS
jgi:hypothetical protein